MKYGIGPIEFETMHSTRIPDSYVLSEVGIPQELLPDGVPEIHEDRNIFIVGMWKKYYLVKYMDVEENFPVIGVLEYQLKPTYRTLFSNIDNYSVI